MSVRAIAVIMVIISHWLPNTFLINKFPNGHVGVDIFFVLSGFLITLILLNYKQLIAAQKLSYKKAIFIFYIKRSLRIFPIYYLLILVLVIINSFITPLVYADSFWYLITYTSNFYFINKGVWMGSISHLWSLSVEEQFYLIWPFIILFTPPKYLTITVIVTIVLGVVSYNLFKNHYSLFKVIPLTCFDAFGVGALLALYTKSDHYKKDLLSKNIVVTIGFLSIACIFIGTYFNNFLIVPRRTYTAIGTFCIIFAILRNTTNYGYWAKILRSDVLVKLGKISYGLYLYHNFMPQLIEYFVPKITLIPKLVCSSILLGMIALFSYQYIEMPFLKLKEKFT